jgi:PhzF family phenazine biosynthesis protein
VDLCGHATLATAHVLWQEKIVDPARPIHFHTRSGILPTRRNGDVIELDFPAIGIEHAMVPAGLVPALGVKPVFVAKTRFDALVEVGSETEVRQAVPDMQRLRDVPTRGVIITSHSDDPQYDFVSRFFAPAVGIDEDPVCGSAHCVLGPFWGQRLGKSELTGSQASARGGVVRVRVGGDRVVLGGTAVTVLKGALL